MTDNRFAFARHQDPLILGIDLGTTFSAVAVVDPSGQAIMVPNSNGNNTTPSVIHFYDADACTVGAEAMGMVVADPSHAVRFIKRSMAEPDFNLEFYGRAYTPQALSAISLRKLRQDTERLFGRAIRDAVITVPAYFNSAQRSATTQAGELAGFRVQSIINEPTAAAIAHGMQDGTARRMLVFDLGGGTFDVTIMDAREGELRTLASDGNAELGGKDWDDRLLDHVSELFFSRFGHDPRDEPRAYQETYEACLSAKIALSREESTFVHIQYQGHRAAIPVTRAEFEMITSDLVAQCAHTCGLVLDKAGLSWSDVDETLLVGGSTRMPMIRRMLHQLTDGTRQSPFNPDECVAMGAALVGTIRQQAAQQQGLSPRKPPSIRQLTITDVTPHPLGIIALDRNLQERVITLVDAGTPVPCERRSRFAYSYDNMTGLRVEVTEGRGEMRSEVMVVGELVIDNLPPRARGTPIEVVYRYGVDQILQIDILEVDAANADEVKGGKQGIRSAQIDLRGALRGSELESIREQLGAAIIGSR